MAYFKKYDPGAYVDMAEKYPELGIIIPPQARTIEDIFQEVGHHKFRILNVITLNGYLVTGGIHHGEQGVIFWNAIYIHNNHTTYAMGGKRMFVLLSTPEEIEGFKAEEINFKPNETENIRT